MKAVAIAIGLSLGLAQTPAHADVTIGVTLSATGPGASLGIPEKNTFALVPLTAGGEKLNFVVLDDGSDATNASKNVQKLLAESRADVIIGSTTVPTALAAAAAASAARTPIVTMSPINVVQDQYPWVFTTPQKVSVMARAVIDHMKASGVKTLGFIGFNDPYGEDWWKNLSQMAEAAGIKVVASERYNRPDTSVVGQALKLLSAKPDAIFIGASGTPSALPQMTLVEQGYKGRIYQSHGSANMDFVRVGGKSVEGTVLPVGPVLVAEQLADQHLSKKPALEYLKLYETVHGAKSRNSFGAYAYDAYLLVRQAIPEALKKAKPGTPEFRLALRDALENIKELPASHGVFNMSAANHNGFDQRAVALVRIEGGDWKLIK